MTITPGPPDHPRRRGVGLKVALVGAGLAAGAITAMAIGASAATTSGTGTTTAATSSASAPQHPNHGSRPVRGDEKSLSAATTAKLKTAALKAVPGGKVYRIESDSGDGVYEAHMTKADGSEVTVKFDKSLAVTGVESGMGK